MIPAVIVLTGVAQQQRQTSHFRQWETLPGLFHYELLQPEEQSRNIMDLPTDTLCSHNNLKHWIFEEEECYTDVQQYLAATRTLVQDSMYTIRNRREPLCTVFFKIEVKVLDSNTPQSVLKG